MPLAPTMARRPVSGRQANTLRPKPEASKAQVMLSLAPHRDIPRQLCKERRRNVAAVRRGRLAQAEFAAAAQHDRSPAAVLRKPVRNCRFLIPSHCLFSRRVRLTKMGANPYIEPLGRAAAWRDGASAKPLTVHTVTEHAAMLSWPCSRRCVDCVGFCASGGRWGKGRRGLSSSGLFDR